jgi:fibronectin-binding autotransporter adhesin
MEYCFLYCSKNQKKTTVKKGLKMNTKNFHKKHFIKNKLSSAVILALFCSTSSALQAADLYWVCEDGQAWDSYPTAGSNPCWATTSTGMGSIDSPSTGDDLHFTDNADNNSIRYYNAGGSNYSSINIDGSNTLLQDRSQTLNTNFETIGGLATGHVVVSQGEHNVAQTLTLGNSNFSGSIGGVPFSTSGNGTLSVTNSGTVDAANMIVGNAGTGTLNINSGGTVTGSNVSLGDATTGEGSININGSSSSLTIAPRTLLGFTSGGDITLGNSGSANMNISNGGRMNNINATLGQQASGSASVTVNGSGSRWDNTGYLRVGDAGSADITLSNSAALNTDSAVLGSAESGSGNVNVINANWNNSNGLVVGSGGSGNLVIAYGSTVNSTTTTVASASTSNGSVTVSNNGTSLNNTGALTVGRRGDGNLTINSAASVTNSNGIIASYSTSNSSVNITDNNSSWNNSGYLDVGRSGTGQLNISNGARVNNADAYIGRNNTGTGTVNVDGSGTRWQNNGYLQIGRYGSGTLNVQNGGRVDNTIGYLGRSSGSDGTANIQGNGSSWNNANDLQVGGTTFGRGGTGTLNVSDNGTVNVGETLQVWDSSTVNLNNATINAATISGNGEFNFNSGTINLSNDLLLNANSSLNNLNLSAIKTLSVNGTTTLAADDILTLDGGNFSTGSLVTEGYFDFKRGTFNLTNDDFTVNSTGLMGSLVQLNQGQIINVSNNSAVFDGSVLSLNNAQFNTDTMINAGALNIEGSAARFSANTTINYGDIAMQGSFATLDGDNLFNNGLINGQGRINASLSNNSSGEIALYRNDNLRFTGIGNTNNGEIKLRGGTAHFDNDLVNGSNGVINGEGALIVNGGLNNEGSMQFSGGNSSIEGDVNNTGSITVTGNATATFYDDVIHNGSEILVREGSAAVYFSNVSGAGAFTGNGLNFFEGTLSVGNSPALSTHEGDFGLGDLALTYIELGGNERGTEYDAIDIAGTASLDGELQVDWYDLGLGDGLFNAEVGDVFDIFYAETIIGEFDLLTLAILDESLKWDLQYLLDDSGMDIVRLNVIAASAVPVPAAVWLFGSGLIALVGIARRKTN